METGNADTPVGNGTLIIKRVNNQEAPNNGVVLEFGYDNNWVGQLYIGDNAHQGIYYNGWSGGVRGSWRRLADEPVTLFDNSSGTTGAVPLSESAANFTYVEIFYFDADKKKGSTTIYSPNSSSARLSITHGGSSQINIYTEDITISGTSITVNSNRKFTSWTNIGATNTMYIYKVIGYR